MKLKIYNSLGKKIEDVEPIDGDTIRIYSCGPTVYDYAHIGNLRKYIFDDLLIRSLKFLGYKTKRVLNITDVGHLVGNGDEGEDKLEVGSRREGKSAKEIAEYFEKAFFEDLKNLNIEKPEIVCRATEHIQEQIELVKILFEKGYAYQISDGVYFDTAKFVDYGKLAGLNIEGQVEGSRVEINDQKRNPSDFALWKFSHLDGNDTQIKRQMEWESPWGVGFPGWHLECSAMSTKYLGQPFEIHTGGVDHIPVHHTNEIAQSEAACERPLAKYWIHSEFVLQDGHKMAKSDGHFLRLDDLEKKGYSALDYRFLCIASHYRSKLNFTLSGMEAAKQARERIMQFGFNTSEDAKSNPDFFDLAIKRFTDAIANDLDTPQAVAIVFETITQANKSSYILKSDVDKFLKSVDEVFALDLVKEFSQKEGIRYIATLPDNIYKLAIERKQAREDKDFQKADEIKAQIISAGYAIEDFQTYTSIDKSSN